jgi:cell division septal protein FtsQ
MSRKNRRHIPIQPRRVPWPAFAIAGVVLIAFAAILLTRGPARPAAAIEVSGQPSLKVDQQSIDFGDVKLGQTVQATFELANVGDQPLRFSAAPYIEVVEGC